MNGGNVVHERSKEYASRIMEAMVTGEPLIFGGNVINNGSIPNLPAKACVEVPCVANKNGITPTFVGDLPLQLAAMNSMDIYSQMLTIEAAHTGDIKTLYQAAMMDPHTGATLSTDEIVALVDELVKAHTEAGFPIF
jgi:alpha-galactosidase